MTQPIAFTDRKRGSPVTTERLVGTEGTPGAPFCEQVALPEGSWRHTYGQMAQE
jgi:hypothetical protein